MNKVKEQSKINKTRGDYAYIVTLWPFKHKGKDNIGIRPSEHGNPYLIVKGLGTNYTKTKHINAIIWRILQAI